MYFSIKNLAAGERSELYCAWIRQNDEPEAPLVAVWIDSAMRCFQEGIAQLAIEKRELPAYEED